MIRDVMRLGLNLVTPGALGVLQKGADSSGYETA